MDSIYIYTVRTPPACILGNINAEAPIPLARAVCVFYLAKQEQMHYCEIQLWQGAVLTRGKCLSLAKVGRTASLRVSVPPCHSARKETGQSPSKVVGKGFLGSILGGDRHR